jgi:hypothetical protein
VCFLGGYEYSHHSKDADVWEGFLETISALRFREHSSIDGRLLAFVSSLLAAFVALWKNGTPFTAKPGQLLASIAGSRRIQDLDEQTGFRDKFAAEFRDVTSALVPQRLPVFIDDLDRCRPEKILEILEAVNFLAVSGECFVILGLDRDRVEQFLAREFATDGEELSDGGQDKAELREARLRLARLYLEKIINVEVAIAPLEVGRSNHLLQKNIARGTAARQPVMGGQRIRRVLSPLRAVLAVVIAVAAFVAGKAIPSEDAAHHAEPSVENGAEKGSATAEREAPAANPASISASDYRPLSVPRASLQYPVVTRESGVALSWAMYAALVLALLVGTPLFIYVWTIRRHVVTYDSKEFTDALLRYNPLVYRTHPTPRSMKRFWNRVRYLAMMQMEDEDPIPASMLVAFSALMDREPGLLERDTPLSESVELEPELVADIGRLRAHAQYDVYLGRFRQLSHNALAPAGASSAARQATTSDVVRSSPEKQTA